MATSKNTKPGVTRKQGMVSASGITIQNLTIRPVERTNLDIQKWRNAHKEAEAINGRRISIYDLYKDVLLDGFLKRMVAKRIAGVTTHRLRFLDKSGKMVDTADVLLKSASFRKLRRALLLQKAWGITVVELGNDNGSLTLFDVPKKHIRAVDGGIVLEQSDTESPIQYRKPPYSNTVVEVGEWDDLGYLLEAAAYVIYKRGGVADWANFAQIFGMPFREARYDGFNEQVRIQLEKAMEKAGSAAYAVLPKEAELTFHESKNTGSNAELFDGLRRAMNEEIMVLVLGATETTTSSKSSGYAQSETHKKTVDEVAEDDRADELAIMNEKVKPVLQYLGLLPADGLFAYEEQVDIAEAGKKVDVAIKLRNAGVPVSDDWFYEITGIPKPDNYDELKAEYEARKAAELQQATEQPTAAKKPVRGKKLAIDDRLEGLMQKLDAFFGDAPSN
jgi:hypothetical protein